MATGIGDTLRAARRRQRQSLTDAAADTRVRESYLAALEEEEFAALGGDVYVKGFLRSYAKFLGLDPEPLLDVYRAEHEQADDGAGLAHQPVAPLPRDRRSGPAVIVVAAGALLLVLAAIGLMAGDDDEDPEVAERGPSPVQSPSPSPDPAPEAPSPETPSPSPESDPTGPAIEGVQVEITVTGSRSWMRVQVDGATTLEGVRENGFSQTFTGEEMILMRIGDAGAVSVEANGEDQGTLGQDGDVVEVTCEDGETTCDVEVVA